MPIHDLIKSSPDICPSFSHCYNGYRSGCLAQRKSVALTRRRTGVQSSQHPPRTRRLPPQGMSSGCQSGLMAKSVRAWMCFADTARAIIAALSAQCLGKGRTSRFVKAESAPPPRHCFERHRRQRQGEMCGFRQRQLRLSGQTAGHGNLKRSGNIGKCRRIFFRQSRTAVFKPLKLKFKLGCAGDGKENRLASPVAASFSIAPPPG